MLDTSAYRLDKLAADTMQKAAPPAPPWERCRPCDGNGRVETRNVAVDGTTIAAYRRCDACDGRGYRQA